jgi:hypothetical protein
MSPAEFIPIAEDTGLIIPLGEWVLFEACSQAQAWQPRHPGLRIAVNLSARQFRQKDLIGVIERVLAETGLAPSLLELELTESMLMHHAEETVTILTRLDEMGVPLAIDDFGTGYSSLSYLKRFPIHSLKIDRSFVRDISSDPTMPRSSRRSWRWREASTSASPPRAWKPRSRPRSFARWPATRPRAITSAGRCRRRSSRPGSAPRRASASASLRVAA